MDARIWKPLWRPRAVVQLMHGMAEHIDRYAPLARTLNAAGYLVAGLNHRGHGARTERLGYFAPEKGWDCLVEDAHNFSQQLTSEYPGLPLILLGHSMGSFAAREYALRYGDELSALVLSGTGHYGPPCAGRAGCWPGALPGSGPPCWWTKSPFPPITSPSPPPARPLTGSAGMKRRWTHISPIPCAALFSRAAPLRIFSAACCG